MHGYYNGKAFHPSSEYLQRRYKYLRKQASRLPPNMTIRPSRDTHSLHSNMSVTPEDICYALPVKRVKPEEGAGSISLNSHVVYIVQGIWRLFKDIPPRSRFVCIVLGILALMILSSVVGIMAQVIAQLMNLVYLILGIAASAVTIEVWRNKRVDKGCCQSTDGSTAKKVTPLATREQ